MKKQIIVFLTFTFTFLFTSCQFITGPDPNSVDYPENAKLHLVKLYHINGWKLLNVMEEYVYDDSGKISQVIEPLSYFGMSGPYCNDYKYDDDGLLESIETFYIADLDDSSRSTNTKNRYFHYDEHGNMVREDIDNVGYGGNDWQYILYEYDDSKLISEERHGNYLGDSVYTSQIYTYDNAGILIEKQLFEIDSTLSQTTTYTYQNGLKIAEVITNSHDEIMYKNDFYYDNNQNLIKSVHKVNPVMSTMNWILRYEYYEE